ncbi:hypothetical protein [Vibrio sp. CK2-1]|uniref:hypothetical protein n=1 Tax=Vibrio sp. CK2-1 TaxID=2912249 RepID=UPI001F1DFF5F|nr:hypothetical protein [Vibrio sp. CK2-1]MCF7354212.1 hypothetical protein [Vibrio sp. CK2-1]
MYLIKQANSVYYTRICCPKALVRLGYPFDIKACLLTKDRHTASLRNLHISALIKQLLHEQLPRINDSPLPFRQFNSGLDSRVENVRQNGYFSGRKSVNVAYQKQYSLYTPLIFNISLIIHFAESW